MNVEDMWAKALNENFAKQHLFKFIHVGYPKTASTFLQEVILKPHNCHHVLSHEGLVIPDWVGAGNKVVSPEELHDLYPNATIIIITRPKAEWLQSWWRHMVSSATPYSGMTYRELMKTSIRARLNRYLDYEWVYDEYKKYFKTVWMLSIKEPDWVLYFCRMIGTRMPKSFARKRKSNSLPFILLRMILNRIYLMFRPEISERFFYFQKHIIGRLDIIRKLRK